MWNWALSQSISFTPEGLLPPQAHYCKHRSVGQITESLWEILTLISIGEMKQKWCFLRPLCLKLLDARRIKQSGRWREPRICGIYAGLVSLVTRGLDGVLTVNHGSIRGQTRRVPLWSEPWLQSFGSQMKELVDNTAHSHWKLVPSCQQQHLQMWIIGWFAVTYSPVL